MGNSHPSLFPYEPLPCADGDLIITAGNDGQFRKLCRGARRARAGRRPAVRPQRGPHRQPRRAAAAAGRAAAHAHASTEWFRDIIAAGVPCGPINTIDGGVAFAEELGLDPVVDGRARRARVGAQPDHLLRDPGRLPAAAARPRRARRGDPPLAGTRAPRPTASPHGWPHATCRSHRCRDLVASRPRSAPRAQTRSACWARTWPPT